MRPAEYGKSRHSGMQSGGQWWLSQPRGGIGQDGGDLPAPGQEQGRSRQAA